tara:strand:+ start:1299 stop:2327 length:1029 start_codon:yes stop_codon:yes gene_type:complete
MGKNSKLIKDQSKSLDPDQIEKEKRFGKNQGIANKNLREAHPTYELAGSEKIEKGKNNSFIIQGRDRPGNLYSGYGGRGATQAARIDLIAGLGSSYRSKDGSYGPPNKDTIINPNFAMDAARIYISQKADIDRYMGLAEVPMQAPAGRSTIGLKADTIRIHSRQDIKIVTGRARYEGLGGDGERLSNGGVNQTVGTISLIAGNYTDKEQRSSFDILRPFGRTTDTRNKLQPIPKGENLSECIEDIVKALQELSALVGTNTSMIKIMNRELINPMNHFATAPGAPTTFNTGTYTLLAAPLVKTMITSAFNVREMTNKNLGMIKLNYLSKYGSDYINSRYVFTT